MLLRAIPLTVVSVVLYLVVVLAWGVPGLTSPLATVGLPSGQRFSFDWAALVVTLGLFGLYVEVLKATYVKNSNSIIDHALSTVLLIVAILLFVLAPAFGTATFFLIVLICAVDVIAGFTVSIKTAQRDFQVDKSFT